MNPQTMIVRFNCHTAVRPAIITVRIEFEDDTLDAVQFQIARDNVRTFYALLVQIRAAYLRLSD